MNRQVDDVELVWDELSFDGDLTTWEERVLERVAALHASADEQSVAPFVGWLRDELETELDDRLLGQAMALLALDQLSANSLAAADWSRLRPDLLLNDCGASCFPTPSRGELRRAAGRLLQFLWLTGLLSRREERRLARLVRRAAIVRHAAS